MKLRKIVDVEATPSDVVDYLRTRLQLGRFRPGDHVRATQTPTLVNGQQMPGGFFMMAQPMLLERGMDAVVAQFDRGDDTCYVIFIRDEHLMSQWVRSTELELIERMPLDWTPSDAASAAAAAADMATRESNVTKLMFDKGGSRRLVAHAPMEIEED